jgi:hypothetical protein
MLVKEHTLLRINTREHAGEQTHINENNYDKMSSFL